MAIIWSSKMLKSLVKVASLLGGLSLNIALGMVYSMSNSSIYVASYMRWVARPGSRLVTLADVSWVYTLNVFFLGITLPVGGYVNKRLGTRTSLYLASALFSASTFACYWFASSYYLFLIIFGCVIGIADGIAFNLPQYCAYRHYPNNIGLASSVVVSGLALSPMLFSPLQTWTVNPDNKMPDLRAGDALYFSDEEILKRVPWMFVAMGLFTTLLCVFSILTIHEPGEEKGSAFVSPLSNNAEDCCDHGRNTNLNSDSGSTAITPTEEAHSLVLDNMQLEQSGGKRRGEDADVDLDGEGRGDIESSRRLKGKGPRPVWGFLPGDNVELDLISRLVRERQFWLVFWLLFLFSQFVHFIASWWKNIGVIHLNISDEMLATVGTIVTSGNNVFGRCFFGSWIDKLGGRICFIIISLSCLCSVVLFQLSLVLGSKVFYFVSIGFVFFNMGAGFVLFPPIVAICFGVEYYTLIYGIVYIGRSLGVMLSSFLTWLFIGSVSIHVIGFAIGTFTLAFFFLSTKFHDKAEFSDETLHKRLFLT